MYRAWGLTDNIVHVVEWRPGNVIADEAIAKRIDSALEKMSKTCDDPRAVIEIVLTGGLFDSVLDYSHTFIYSEHLPGTDALGQEPDHNRPPHNWDEIQSILDDPPSGRHDSQFGPPQYYEIGEGQFRIQLNPVPCMKCLTQLPQLRVYNLLKLFSFFGSGVI